MRCGLSTAIFAPAPGSVITAHNALLWTSVLAALVAMAAQVAVPAVTAEAIDNAQKAGVSESTCAKTFSRMPAITRSPTLIMR